KQRFSQTGVYAGPDVDDLVIALPFCNNTEHIVVLNFLYFTAGVVDESLLFFRNHDVTQTDGKTTAECRLESKFFDIIKELSGTSKGNLLKYLTDNSLEFFLRQQLVDITYFLRYKLVKEYSTGYGVDHFLYQFAVFIFYSHFYLDKS